MDSTGSCDRRMALSVRLFRKYGAVIRLGAAPISTNLSTGFRKFGAACRACRNLRSSFLRRPESSREKLVSDLRREDVWTPASAVVTSPFLRQLAEITEVCPESERLRVRSAEAQRLQVMRREGWSRVHAHLAGRG